MIFSHIIYHIALFIYESLILALSLFNKRAKLWVNGRKKQKSEIERLNISGSLWFHAASLGEFEQGRSLIELIKSNHSDLIIVLTFFSPSGYSVRKNYEFADYVFYLPPDGKKSSLHFIEKINPKAVFFIKYEFWFYYYQILYQKKIPVFQISAVFRKNHPVFRSYTGLLNQIPKFVTHFFIQDENSAKILKENHFHNFTITGDTRIDRVLRISASSANFSDQTIQQFSANNLILIAGSSYTTEENFIRRLSESKKYPLKFIIVPHEINKKRIKQLIKTFKEEAVFWTENNSGETLRSKRILIVDTIGILNKIYKYGHISFIGGGFNKGIHNLLEPAAHHLPVIFGPKNIHKFPEAGNLLKNGGGFCIKNYREFIQTIEILLHKQTFKLAGEKAFDLLNRESGGTQKVYSFIMQNYGHLFHQNV